MKPKTRLDARLIEVLINLNIFKMTYIKQNKRILLHHKNEHNRERRDVEDRLSEAKRIEATYEDKLYQAYRYTDKMRVRMESLETQAEDYSYFLME